MATIYLQLETRFLKNLNERTIAKAEQEGGHQEWVNEEIKIVSFYVPEGASYIDKTFDTLHWGRIFNTLVVKYRRGKDSVLLPSGKTTLKAGDKVYVVGDTHSLDNFKNIVDIPGDRKVRTLKEFMEIDYPDDESALSCVAIKVNGSEPYCNQTIANTEILQKGKCLILGMQKNGFPILMPDVNMMIQKDDIIWVIGSNNNIGRMVALSTTNSND